MNSEEYQKFTLDLQNRLKQDPRVLGLIAVGSMSERDYSPDRWSDHDFFVVVSSGSQEHFRTNLSWLPNPGSIVFHFRETAHGLKVLYRSGHLLEFAIFDPNELHLAKVNRYRVLLDRDSIENHMQQVVLETRRWDEASASDDLFHFGQFLTNILVGFGRYQRGEKLSGQQFVKNSAFRHLTILLTRHLPSADKSVLDNIDPFRRIEIAYPKIARELNELCNLDVPAAALGLLLLTDRELKSWFPVSFGDALEVVIAQLDSGIK